MRRSDGQTGSQKTIAYMGSSRLLFTKLSFSLLLTEVFPPRTTKPSSHSSQPTSRRWNLVPWGQTFETWFGTAPSSTCFWIAVGNCDIVYDSPSLLFARGSGVSVWSVCFQQDSQLEYTRPPLGSSHRGECCLRTAECQTRPTDNKWR